MLLPVPILIRLKVNSIHRRDSLKSNKLKKLLLKKDSPQRKHNALNGEPPMKAPKRPGNFNDPLFFYINRTAERLVVE
jgi:hypothetical protein